jgi:hypothetical protein
MFTPLYHANKARVLQQVKDTPALNRFFQSCMLTYRNAQSADAESVIEFKHLRETMLDDLRYLTDLPRVFGRFAKMGYTLPFVLSREQHPTEPRTVLMLAPDHFPADFIQVRLILFSSAFSHTFSLAGDKARAVSHCDTFDVHAVQHCAASGSYSGNVHSVANSGI